MLYVDDMLIASKSRYAIDKLKKDLSFEFEMKDLGEVKKVLGMEIERDRRSGKVSLTQKGYLRYFRGSTSTALRNLYIHHWLLISS